MRKLPVFFLIDLSESMVGEPLQWVKKGMEHLIRGLKKNPYALETVWIEIIGFAGVAKVIEPFEELALFYPPDFPVGGGTYLSKGLECLMSEIDKNVKLSKEGSKGDWKPLVFIFTDGQPTDDYSKELNDWESIYKPKSQTLIASLGHCLTSDLTKRIAHEAVQLENSDEASFDSYFKWMTDSIVSSSIQVSYGVDIQNGLTDIRKEDGLVRIDLEKKESKTPLVDDNFVVLLAACQKNENKFLIKYQKGIECNDPVCDDFDKVYRLSGAYPIDYKKYEEMSASFRKQKVDSKYLRNIPSCPCCSSSYSIAVCQCGGIFCIGNPEEEQTCPWCGESAIFGFSDESLNIDRRLG
jgi:uncharacterized protein YegL